MNMEREHSQAKAQRLATLLVARLTEQGMTIATAESLTGGWIAQLITSVPGSSAVFPGGIVSYSEQAKIELLGVSESSLLEHGVVSEAVVREMAAGARECLQSDYAVAVSGIAGPDGGTLQLPVGTVWIAWLGPQGLTTRRCLFTGDREAVRIATVCEALTLPEWHAS